MIEATDLSPTLCITSLPPDNTSDVDRQAPDFGFLATLQTYIFACPVLRTSTWFCPVREPDVGINGSRDDPAVSRQSYLTLRYETGRDKKGRKILRIVGKFFPGTKG
ncbi:hypothetical protein B296_00002845 [Ensete ventricosum]|uniref:Uncharacterized protein n=1 Tax=Ensete ventricosum TaxID=4639 RepID=A0A427BCH1_ENSVE|nr:hypothetical protein B296_00002845 [Ensete ventricosum]